MARRFLLPHRLLLPLVVLTAVSLAHGGQAPKITAITNVTVIDPAGEPPRTAVVLIEGSRISRVEREADVTIPGGATVIDGRGKYVIPGLADMHQHLGDGYTAGFGRAEQNLRRMLAFGFTTIFSTSHAFAESPSFAQLKKIAAAEDAAMPRFFGVGTGLTVKGGHASQPNFGGHHLPDTPDDARRMVQELKSQGVDAIKFIYDEMLHAPAGKLPIMRADVMQAIIAESHAQGLKAYVHATNLDRAKEVFRAGADGLVHCILSGVVDDEFLGLMKARNAVYITTHSLFHALIDPPAWARRLEAIDDRKTIPAAVYERFKSMVRPGAAARLAAVVATQRANLKKISDAGILVVAGTDTSVTGVLLGVSSQMELILLVEDGLTPRQALQAATANAARMLGRERLQGTVSAGSLADLVILDGDPLADITNVRRIHKVIKGGIVYDPADLLRPQ